MAKTKVEIAANEYNAYKEAAEVSGVKILEANAKKKISGPVQLGNNVVAIVSFRDPFYLMKWVQNVYQFARQKQQEQQAKKK